MPAQHEEPIPQSAMPAYGELGALRGPRGYSRDSAHSVLSGANFAT